MQDIKTIVAKNIAALRQQNGMTQLELAERLNYSDKAVSKWERGDSLPDVAVLTEIADMFGVPLDWLVRADHPKPAPAPEEKQRRRYTHAIITAVSVLFVWLIAMFVFVLISLAWKDLQFQWLAFVYAVPISLIVWLVFNSVWFNPRWNFLIISLLMWAVLATIHITVLLFGANIRLIYLLGIPGQLIILLWSRIRKKPPVITM